MTHPDPSWVSAIREQLGADLRSIIHLHRDGQEIKFVRDGIEPVADDRVRHAFQTLMFDVVGTDRDEAMNEHGELFCVTRRFEEAVEMHFPLSETEGVAIAVDRGGDPTDDAVIPALREVLVDGLETAPGPSGPTGTTQSRRANR